MKRGRRPGGIFLPLAGYQSFLEILWKTTVGKLQNRRLLNHYHLLITTPKVVSSKVCSTSMECIPSGSTLATVKMAGMPNIIFAGMLEMNNRITKSFRRTNGCWVALGR